MKLVTNTNRRQRWEDPVSDTTIPPNTTVPVTDKVAAGVYFFRASHLRKPRLVIVDEPKKILKKNKPTTAAKEG